MIFQGWAGVTIKRALWRCSNCGVTSRRNHDRRSCPPFAKVKKRHRWVRIRPGER